VKTLLQLEDIGLAGLAVYLFLALGYAWWLLLVLFLVPDAGIAGYALGPRLGAVTYNVLHHRGLAVLIFVLGALLGQPLVEAAGLLLLFHASVDRALGFGLKYTDSFRSTHLGEIGRETPR